MFDIIINNISKSYKDVKALKSIDFKVEKGEIFGLIGPDGAGKTTLMRLIATLLIQDTGYIKVLGLDSIKDFKQIRAKLGYMPGKFSLYPDLSVIENLELFASIFGTTVKENYYLIKDIYSQIEPFRDRPAGKLSGGMKQKLALSCALIHKPDLLLLDEPTTGVDPVSRKEFWDMLHNLNKLGITIFVSTPYMDEAARCDRVALIQSGEIMKISTPDNLIKNFGEKLYGLRTANKYKTLLDLREYDKIANLYPSGELIHFTLKNGNYNLIDLVDFLKKKDRIDIEINEITPNIEDCFMKEMIGLSNESILN